MSYSFINRLRNSENFLKTAFNSFWMMSDKVVAMVISLIVGVLVARYLGPDNFGLINYSLSIIAIFSAICKLGLESIIVKEFVDKRKSDGRIMGTAFTMQLSSTLIAMGLIYLVVQISSPDDQLLHIISLIQSTYLIFRTAELFDYWFQSRLKSKFVTLSRLVSHIIVGGFKLYLVFTKAELEWFALSNVLDYLVFAVFLSVFYKRQDGDMRFSYSHKFAKELLKLSWPFILSGLAVTIYMKLDQIMLGQILGHQEVGIYSAGSRIAAFWYFVPIAIINSARPSIMGFFKAKDNKKYLGSLQILFGLIFWFSVAVAIVTTLVADPLCNLLYGAAYEGAGDVLSINVWAGAFAMLGSARGAWIICENLQRYSMFYIFFGLVFKIILNLFMIEPYGVLGASYSTFLCQFAVAMIFPLIFSKTRPIISLQLKGVIHIRKIFS